MHDCDYGRGSTGTFIGAVEEIQLLRKPVRVFATQLPSMKRPAVFIDRDGTISEEVGCVNHPSRFQIYLYFRSKP